MRLTHTLPNPWLPRPRGEIRDWLALPMPAVIDGLKPIAVLGAAVLLGPLALILAAIVVLTTWPAWVLTMPVLGVAWLAQQLTPLRLTGPDAARPATGTERR